MRNALKNIAAGMAGGSIVATHQEYGVLVATIATTLIFIVTVGSFWVADLLYGPPDTGDADSDSTPDS
jgi:hypothetical protein